MSDLCLCWQHHNLELLETNLPIIFKIDLFDHFLDLLSIQRLPSVFHNCLQVFLGDKACIVGVKSSENCP
jgi:hypothetical protein